MDRFSRSTKSVTRIFSQVETVLTFWENRFPPFEKPGSSFRILIPSFGKPGSSFRFNPLLGKLGSSFRKLILSFGKPGS